MRHLTQSRVMLRAALAALITCVACYPRLALWLERPHSVFLLISMLFFCAYVLWAFVFAWQKPYAGRSPLGEGFPPRLWGAATLYAVAWASLLHFLIDPQLRVVAPKEFPTSVTLWLTIALFTVALNPLFFTFAPFAFFMRLFRRPQLGVPLTVLFGVFVLFLKLQSGAKLPTFSLALELTALRVVGGFVALYFYQRGGIPLVLWMVLIQESRHGIDLAAAPVQS